MHFSKTFAATAALTGFASAAPLEKRQNIDTTVLQFALTLEHLENVFYKQALQNFTEEDFTKAGYSADYYNNLRYVASDEQSHVQVLSSAIQAAGQQPVQACQYSFPYKDVPSFITLSSILEGVGTSAYLGGAPLITSKQYLTVAGSILVTEAKHTSYQRAAIGEVPFANPYGTPLDPTSVFTLASMFIVSCPSSNMALPFTPFPVLAADAKTCTCEEPMCGEPSDYIRRDARPGYHKGHGDNGWYDHWDPKHSNTCTPPSAGAQVTFNAADTIKDGSYVTFVSGLNVVSMQGDINGKDITATVPMQAQGQTYVFVTSQAENGTLMSADVSYGPAILEVNPPAPMIDYSILKH